MKHRSVKIFNSSNTERLFENLDKLVEIHRITYGYVAQFTDMLAWFDKNDWKELIEPSKLSRMVKRNLLRGNNNKLFFAEANCDVTKIFRIDEVRGKRIKYTDRYEYSAVTVEVFELKESSIIFLEPDNEIIEKDSTKQAIFILDDKMHLRHLVSEEDKQFQQVKVVDLSRLREVLID